MIKNNITSLVRVGNSIGIIVPIQLLRAQGMQRGDDIVLELVANGGIMFRKLSNEAIAAIKNS